MRNFTQTLNRILVVAFGVGLLVYWLNAYSYTYGEEDSRASQLYYYKYLTKPEKKSERVRLAAFVYITGTFQEAKSLLEMNAKYREYVEWCLSENNRMGWCAEFIYHTRQCELKFLPDEQRTEMQNYRFLTCSRERNAGLDPLDAKWVQ